MLLKEAAQNIGSFDKIARTVKFSCKYAPKDIEERWRALLYNSQVSM